MYVCMYVLNVPYQINHASLNSRHKFCFFSVADPGARFSKVPIINGPAKLLLFAYKIEISTVVHLT